MKEAGTYTGAWLGGWQVDEWMDGEASIVMDAWVAGGWMDGKASPYVGGWMAGV